MDQRKATSFTLLMAVGTFVVVMDNTIMNVSIQALVADLHTTVSGVQSAIALNALMMAAFVLFGGKLADIVGMKKTFMAGVFLYIAGSLTASFSGNLTVFILGWCLIQGFGAALMLPNVQTIIRATLTDEGPRARAYGAMAGVNALGAAMGPVIGGLPDHLLLLALGLPAGGARPRGHRHLPHRHPHGTRRSCRGRASIPWARSCKPAP